MARLCDVCEILDSKRVPITAKDRTPGPYPYYGANGVQDYVADYIFDDELVLLAEDGGYFGSPDRPIAYRVSGKCWVNNHAHVLKPKACIDVDYLCYSLMFRDVSDIVNGATRQKLTQADMREIEIPLLPLEKQTAVVAKIGKVFQLIALRKEQLAKLDQLVKSRFIELFGNRGENPFGFPTITMGCVYKFQYGKGNNIPEDKGEYLCYGSNGVVGHHTEYNSEDSPIIGHIGAYAGIVNWGKGKHYVTYNGVICKLIHDKVNPVYGFYLLQLQDYNTVAKAGAAQPFVSYKDLEAPVVNIPSLERQNQFAAFVEQTDKSKLAIQASLDKLETLKKSLMQQYFG